jgi:hypothetical protein
MPITDIVTPAYVKQQLGGARYLDNDDQDLISDDVYWSYIHAGLAQLEASLGFSLRDFSLKTTTTKFDVMGWDGHAAYLKFLPNRPVTRVVSGGFRQGDLPIREFPSSWFHIKDPTAGSVQIIVGKENYTDSLFFPNLTLMYAPRDYNPQYLHITYEYGFERALGEVDAEEDDTVINITPDPNVSLEEILRAGLWLRLGAHVYRVRTADGNNITLTSPLLEDYEGPVVALLYDDMMVSAISAYAAIPILEQLGILTFGPGLTGRSVAMDSLRQQKSFRPDGPYAGLIKIKQDQLEQLTHNLLDRWGPTHLFYV